MGADENEDYIAALLRFRGGARGILESSRAPVGKQCSYGIEVHGARRALSWDFRRMGKLQLCLDQDYENAHFSTHCVAPGDGDLARFQPASGIARATTTSRSWRLITSFSRLQRAIRTEQTLRTHFMPPRSSRRWPSRHTLTAG